MSKDRQKFTVAGCVVSIATLIGLTAGVTVQHGMIEILEHDNKVLQNQLDSHIINYERSAEDIHYTIEEYKGRLQTSQEEVTELQRQLNEANEQIQQKEEQVKGLNTEIEQLKQKAVTTRVAPSYSFSSSEINLLQRLVEAEAGGESIEGRIAVANVILNRIKSAEYPNTIHDVIYQTNQFEVVSIGTIDTKVPSAGTIEAVNRALSGEKVVPDSTVIFWAKYLDRSHAIWSHCDIIATIGVHHFSDGWR